VNRKPTLLGAIAAVTGAAVSIRQSANVASGIAIIGGKSYRVGQVGGFVRIPQGYHDLFGIVSEVGVSAAPKTIAAENDRGERWITVQLVGEVIGGQFERGISQYPNVNDEVHLVTEEDLVKIYGAADAGQIFIGRLASAEGISVKIDIDKLVTRHSAILGSTGTGKSTTVASLIRSIALGNKEEDEVGFPSARILLIDIHGEYARALEKISAVFRVNPTGNEKALHIPYWALDPVDVLGFLMGRLDDRPLSQVLDKIQSYRTKRIEAAPIAGVDVNSITAEIPIPYSLHQLWSDLIDPEVMTIEDNKTRKPALDEPGDAKTLKMPKYKPHGSGSTPPHINTMNVLGIRRQLDQMRSRLLDKQYDFLLHPGEWEPDLQGVPKKDLSELLASWMGHDKPITILDLSGVPSAVSMRLIGSILGIVFDSLFWSREKSEGGISRPVLVVMEEAHRYLGKDSGSAARSMVQRIVKEGRKFGVGAMIVSQRPSEVDDTILSQCGTFIALRLSNDTDRNRVAAVLPDNLAGIVNSLPVLRTGEAIVIGEAARLPIRCRIALPNEENRPNSEDPSVSKSWYRIRMPESFDRVAASWRSQNPRWIATRVTRTSLTAEEIAKMERQQVMSSTVLSIGYDEASETLEVEFARGGVYQYYNFPRPLFEQFMASDSKGQFLHVNIKDKFPFSRV
jgi:hypothetical protein